ncbi:MAG TPA: hypothetical protein VLA58_00715 [Chitinophagaceae bacterium]|nr:hypothetical protein [Chitinophagaceae bacterium]
MKQLLFTLVLATLALQSFSQLNYSAEKAKLYKRLTERAISPNYSREVDRFYNHVCDSLVKANVSIDGDPIESILIRLFGNTAMELDRKTISRLRVPSVNVFFLELLKTYHKESIRPIIREMGINRTRILANAFIGLPIGDTLSTAASAREMAASPQLIPKRIYDPRFVNLRDTILYYLVNDEPEVFIRELKANPQMQQFADASTRAYVKAVANLKDRNNLNKILPFGMAILEGRISADSVMLLASKPANYIAAYTSEVIRLQSSEDPAVREYLNGYLRNINKELAKMFIEPINQLHESTAKERFYVLNSLSAQDLYFIILGGESVFYTSSFLYTFNQFLTRVEKEGLEPFFERIGYYKFGEFLSISAGYGMTGKLIKKMDEEKFGSMLAKYIAMHVTARQTDRDLIMNGMTISEILFDMKEYKKARDIIISTMDDNKIRQQHEDVLVQRMYGGFKDILEDSMQGKLKDIEQMYEVMHIDRLKSKDTIVQVGLFYDDEDGVTSFANYLNFLPAKEWAKEDKGNYLVFRSNTGNPMLIYLNKVNTPAGDGVAQDEMMKAITDAGLSITYFTHRGHSYHLHKSIKRLPESAELVYLGSCGGYNEVLKVFQSNPDAQIISTRNIGSKYINDPVLSKINNQAVANVDINWVKLWSDFDKSFTAKNTRELFSAYIPPNKYIGIMFIREVFNF